MNHADSGRFVEPSGRGERSLGLGLRRGLEIEGRAEAGRTLINEYQGQEYTPSQFLRESLGKMNANKRQRLDLSDWFAGDTRLRRGFRVHRPNYEGTTGALQRIQRPPLSTGSFVARNDPKYRRDNVLLDLPIDGSDYGQANDPEQVRAIVTQRTVVFSRLQALPYYWSGPLPTLHDRPQQEREVLANLFLVNWELRHYPQTRYAGSREGLLDGHAIPRAVGAPPPSLSLPLEQQLAARTAARILTVYNVEGILDQVRNNENSLVSYHSLMNASVLQRGPVYYTGTDSGLINIWALRPPVQGRRRQLGTESFMARQDLEVGHECAPEPGRHLWLVLEVVEYKGPCTDGGKGRLPGYPVWRFRPHVTLTDQPLPASECTGTYTHTEDGKKYDWHGAAVYVGQVIADNDHRNYSTQLPRMLRRLEVLVCGSGQAPDMDLPPTDLRELPTLSHVHVNTQIFLY